MMRQRENINSVKIGKKSKCAYFQHSIDLIDAKPIPIIEMLRKLPQAPFICNVGSGRQMPLEHWPETYKHQKCGMFIFSAREICH